MLFTRCPHCNTTFRITAEALSKADGQVRCGRCANIFNAYAQLREQADDGAEAPRTETFADTAGQASAPEVEVDTGEAPASEAAEVEHDDAAATEPAETRSGDSAAGKPDAAASDETESEADTAAAVIAAPDADDDVGEEIVLGGDEPGPVPVSTTWLPDPDEEPPLKRAALWRVGTAAAFILLLLQLTHHFRAQVAGQPVVGPIVQSAYALLGAPVLPRWNVEQYQILDWIATAEPAADGRGNLVISARIQNRGPDEQPYPHVHVELKDRWETAIGSRVFAPREYLANESGSALMAAGDTASAQLTVVDPGPDAYGFEIDVCVQQDEQQLRCATDQVFR